MRKPKDSYYKIFLGWLKLRSESPNTLDYLPILATQFNVKIQIVQYAIAMCIKYEKSDPYD